MLRPKLSTQFSPQSSLKMSPTMSSKISPMLAPLLSPMLRQILLVAWIVGISSMAWPLHILSGWRELALILLLPLLFSVMLMLYSAYRPAQYDPVSKAMTQAMFLRVLAICSVLMAGHLYAQHALTTRLALRTSTAFTGSVLIYVDRIASNSHADPNRWQHQVWVLDQQPQAVLWQLSYPAKSAEDDADYSLQLGRYYRVSGQVKPAHSYAVPGVFDRERWMLQQGLMASMQVETVQLLDAQHVNAMGHVAFVQDQQGSIAKLNRAIESLRLKFRVLIQASNATQPGLLLALLTGDQSLMSVQTQALFQRLGITHLLAISGPHVLLFALMLCFALAKLLRFVCPQIFLRYPKPYLLIGPFLLAVWGYAALVGFEIPALRTLFTTTVICVLLLFKQALRPLKMLLLSASLLLLFDPFSILSAAFWLSFGACLMLLRVYQSMQGGVPNTAIFSSVALSGRVGRVLYGCWLFIAAQWKIFVALLPLLMFIFQQLAWLAPIANLIAIPLIGSVVVPLEVLAASGSFVFPAMAALLFYLADQVLEVMLRLLGWLDQVFAAKTQWLALSFWQSLSLSLAIWMLLLPRGVLPRLWIGVCAVVGLVGVAGQKVDTEFELNVIDVGQGQALLLKLPQHPLPQHKLMIDVGGIYNEKQWGIADHIIIPYLMQQGISRLDQVILSHLDQDHSGAFEPLSKQVRIDQVYSNQQDERFEGFDFQLCQRGQQWQYGQILVQILLPDAEQLADVAEHQNERSCVVYVQVPQARGYQNFLIMGDAGWEAEYQLLQRYPDLKVDVLILGHHGSRHSSAYAFLQQLQPKLAIASAGWNNRYGHPHALVKARLADLGIPMLSSIEQGSIQFYLDAEQQMQWRAHRQTRPWLDRSQ
ncbi:competence protein ComEC [Acinetobacter calcoaceticus]|uniref:Competence protein ComEC n=1 Tax=Acinetobacter calcoaceticus TaxID=471 RepID=A0A4V6NJC7_ACICA|nr:competence protein ComEC [Acinetobacter calcoaceticus]